MTARGVDVQPAAADRGAAADGRAAVRAVPPSPHARTQAPGAASPGPPTTLSREGGRGVLVAAAGRHVLVAYQRNDRLELKIVC